jgi:spore photoproduct lyase
MGLYYKREVERLERIKYCVQSNFPDFGVNKRQEITRLLYEISKREAIPPENIIKKDSHNYTAVKKYLLKRRFPSAVSSSKDIDPYLPGMKFNEKECCGLKRKNFYPKNVFIERNASDSFLAKRFKERFPKARFTAINSIKDCLRRNKRFSIKDYNKRKDNIFIVSETHDFFKKCPCTKKALGCGYHIFNLGFGCISECTYCFLQGYSNNPGIVLPANIESFFERFKSYKRPGMRIGTGEFSDSLALDDITCYSIPIIEFFRKQRGVIFEFKTKSGKIENVLKARPSNNIVISWSLNPRRVINDNEYFTASLKERLDAAVKCAGAGYRVGFHFDPVIYFKGWENEYRVLIENLFRAIKPAHIAWISIGTFRFSPGLKQIIEKRFPKNKILDEELLLGYDNKLRYPYALRYEIYKKMLKMLLRHSGKPGIYLCMENTRMWKALRLPVPHYRAQIPSG